ncbi:MAG: hypothetical protein K0S44_2253 [Bacteroidetes bacterium]|jgi:hypothetical protein|nr:hypothetical protein [Bacteroidota bacterium]
MKKIIIISLAIFLTTINAIAQKQNEKPIYTFCGKPGGADYTMTLEELKKCKKELTIVDKNLKINSYSLSIGIVEKQQGNIDTVFVTHTITDNILTKTAKEKIDETINKSEIFTIIIKDVIVIESDKKRQVAGMNINLK